MSALQNLKVSQLRAPAIAEPEKQSIRVLFVSHTYVVGINQGKLAAIARYPLIQVGLMAPAKWHARGWNQRFDLEQSEPGIAYQPAQVLLNGRTGGYLYRLGSILKALRQFKPDILQVEEEVFSLSTFQMAVVARLTGVPLAVFGWENLEPDLSPLRQRLRKFVLKTAKLIVAGNQDGANLLRAWGYTGTVATMPQMGVDAELFEATTRSIPTQRPVQIGFMGRLVHEKGIDLLFQAARQLQAHDISFQVVLCGSGPDEAPLKTLAEQIGISEQVVWKGKVPHADVPSEMAQFDILVLPSRSISTWKEQFGHVLIEAMAMGVPVVGSSCGEIPHVIGRSDLVFAENDAEALASVLQRLVCEDAWYTDASQYGIDRVQAQYTHERIAERLIASWNSVLEN